MNAQTVVGVGNIYACEALFFLGLIQNDQLQKFQEKDIIN